MKNSKKKDRAEILERPARRPRGHAASPSLDRFCGAWQDKRSAEEIVQDIYSKRS